MVRDTVAQFDDAQTGAGTLEDGRKVGNGNLWYTLTQGGGTNTVRWQTYTSFNMVKDISFGTLTNASNPTATTADRKLSFIYGPEHQRLRMTTELTSNAPSQMKPGTTWYLNGPDRNGLSYEKEVKGGITEERHYLSGAGIAFAVVHLRSGTLGTKPAQEVNYWHHDHLGSVAAISNSAGQLIERLAYDPWGKRRNINGNADPQDQLYGKSGERGYTQHEHLDEVGLINMNGRIYDPMLGRFLSADPYIQSPDNLQSYNRYAYVLNNPLAYSDPTGYFSLRKWFRAAFKIFAPVLAFLPRPLASMLINIASLSCGPWAPMCAGAGQAALAYYHGASLSQALQTGVKAGVTAWLFQQAGDIGKADSFERYFAHGVAGCISSVINDGKCGQGAASAVFGKFTTNMTDGIENDLARGVVTVVAGGVGSVLTGGSFKDGATTAAYGYLFNYLVTKPWRGGNSAWATAMELNSDTRARAFLETLAQQESGGRYDIIVGGQTFDDFSEHPNVFNKDLNSTAAGAYQFTKGTWDEVSRALNLKDFSPFSQDLGAIHLLNMIGAIDQLLSGNLEDAIFSTGKRWDAFPINSNGISISGGQRSITTITELYKRKCGC